ncbi:hypothetical protein [Pseudonocardia sp. GCM10023141]|uniref:hypothetical protein n=1 Tax=Pseudonocardia sp. GCM10023141 TaxID=3252653 RepID=UPI0036D27936
MVVVVVGAAAAAGMAGLAWMVWPSPRVAGCTDISAAVPIEASGPSTVSDEQRRNAAVIVATGRNLKIPERGLWVGLATAMQESGLRNLSYGDRDSLGLFQQRPSQGWGSPAQVLDPEYAATQFFTRLLAVPDWTAMPLWQAAQSVQRSGFPLAYAKWEQDAADLLAGISPAASTAGGNGSPGCGPSGPGGMVPAFPGGTGGCVEDDPTTTGCVTATTRYALAQAEGAFGGLRKGPIIRSTSCYSPRPPSQKSDHPLGKACDLFPGTAGSFAWGPEQENGWRAAEWFRSNADALQISYVIWQGRIWISGVPDQNGWGREYTGGGIHDASDATGGHYDHLHVSFRT